MIFSGGMTEEFLAEAREVLGRVSLFLGDTFFQETLIQDLASEIGQPESHTPPKKVIAGSYGKEDAERWIWEFREANENSPGNPPSRHRRGRRLVDP